MKKIILTFLLTSIFFSIIIISIQKKGFPYSLYLNWKERRNISNTENQLLLGRFKNPIIDKQLYSPVKTPDELSQRIKSFETNMDSLYVAYDKIKIVSASFIENHIFQVNYLYLDKTDSVYAYFIKSQTKQNTVTRGFNIIPGSGVNQSSAMFYNENNYQQNIDDIAGDYGDVYIYVKPNEDFLAIHNGSKKIAEDAFVNYLINSGSSYSAYYFVQTLVLSKYIKNTYDELIVCGLSQGGTAALFNALQSEPTKALIASGYSFYFYDLSFHKHDMFMVPGLYEVMTKEKIVNLLSSSPTQYLFTYGKNELGTYHEESRSAYTAGFFKNLNNVKWIMHNKGHVYDAQSIKAFLAE